MDLQDLISMNKAIAWEQAKCALRTIVAIEGQRHSDDHNEEPPFLAIEKTVEHFIKGFEDKGFAE